MSVTTERRIPSCPFCEGEMTLRKSQRGEFWGCKKFPACRGTRNVGEEDKVFEKSEYEPIVKLPGTYEQEAIWAHMLKGRSHIVVNAGPGVGKTWASIQGCIRLPRTLRILFIAFNKHIAKEANGKLRASGIGNVEACTFHSLGFRILRQNFKTLGHEPNEAKMTEIMEWLSPMPTVGRGEWRRTINMAERLCSLVKSHLVKYREPGFQEEIERLADHYGIDLNGIYPAALALVPPALDECKKRAEVSVDYDDMPWLPIEMDLPMKYPADFLITDESQDLNIVNHELTFKASKGRIMVVGDRHQSIYAWRGADAESLDTLKDRLAATSLGVKEFPLTITQRCAKSSVMLAQMLYPDIQALDDAPMGEVLQLTYDKAVAEMKVNDMVICRVNRDLIKCAYALIRRGVRPLVKGRDIGEGLLSLIDKLTKDEAWVGGPNELPKLLLSLQHYRFEQESKLLAKGDKAQGRIDSLNDKCACVEEFINQASSIHEMRARIDALFSNENKPNVVVLGTVHRTKGLEAERVFILSPELIPHPMAVKPWEKIQEKNIAWIAVTRAKFDKKTRQGGTLIFCGPLPSLFALNPMPPKDVIEPDKERFADDVDEDDVTPAPPAPPAAKPEPPRKPAPVSAKPATKLKPNGKPKPVSKPVQPEDDDDEPPF